MWVFAYGSLLHPASLQRTMPQVDPDEAVPARLAGYRRAFDVAFPNDGSQSDKTYLDERGDRPPVVSLCGITPAPRARVTGVCIPVDDTGLHALTVRERRYDPHDVSAAVRAYPNQPTPAGPVLAFVGRPEFTAGGGGVLAAGYLETILAGAAYWEAVAPGFEAETLATTDLPRPEEILPLRRIDHPAGERP